MDKHVILQRNFTYDDVTEGKIVLIKLKLKRLT